MMHIMRPFLKNPETNEKIALDNCLESHDWLAASEAIPRMKGDCITWNQQEVM